MEPKPDDDASRTPKKTAKKPAPWVKRLAIALAKDIEEEKRTWGGIDVNQIAAYADGQCTDEEKAKMEKAMRQYPAVRECVEAFSQEDRQFTWGDVDENMLASYVAGVCTADEKRRVEKAMQEYPDVRECVEAATEFLGRHPGPRPDKTPWAERSERPKGDSGPDR